MDNNNFIKSLSKNLLADVKSILEGKKVDQDGDGDNDFDDIQVARYMAGGMSKKEAIAKAKAASEEGVKESSAMDAYADQIRIDELSKSTLATYAIRAKNQMGRDEYRAGVRMGVRTMDGKGQDEMEKAHVKRADKRHHGIDMALNKLAKEEVEQVDELSKGTLGSYIKKAAGSAADKGMEHGVKKAEQDEMDRVMNRHMSFSDKDKVREIMKTTHRDVEKPREKAGRRIQGIGRAVSRLTKEEAENVDEGLGRLFRKKPTVTVSRMTSSQELPDGEKPFQKATNTGPFKQPEVQRDAKGRTLYQRVQAARGVKEEVELDEAMDAKARYEQHHAQLKTLLKSIGEHLDKHKKDAHAYTDRFSKDGRKGPHWGHVGDLASYTERLGDVHDQLARKGEYNESVEVEDDIQLTEQEIEALNLIAEEVEGLEELSTDTLKDYRKKARAQGNAIVDKMKMGAGDWSKDQVDTKTLRKRSSGAQMSGKQLVKRGESLKTEEVEGLDEISAETKDAYAQKAAKQLPGLFNKSGSSAENARKYYNRKNAVRKVANEEVEQVDELSKSTLHSYIEKSARDVHNQAYRAGKKEGGEGKYDSDKILKSLTRQIGISKATRKLAGKAKVNTNESADDDQQS